MPQTTTADTYGDLDRLQTLLDEYQQAEELDPKKLPRTRDDVRELVVGSGLHRDPGVQSPPADFGAFANEIDGYLCEIGALQFRGGLHVLGEPPEGEKLVHFLTSLLRLDTRQVPGIRGAIVRGDVEEAIASFARVLVSDVVDGRTPGATCARGSGGPASGTSWCSWSIPAVRRGHTSGRRPSSGRSCRC